MLTSIQQSKHRSKQPIYQYQIVHKQLTNLVDTMNDKILNKIQLVQHTYLDKYKQQVKIMSNQLKKIRATMDQQLIKKRSNQRLFFLQEERDFFRAQVIKLNQDLSRLTLQNNQLKSKLQQKTQQLFNYHKIIYDLQTKIYKIKNQSIEAQKIKQQQKFQEKQTFSQTHKKQQLIKNQIIFNQTTKKMKPSYSLRKISKPIAFQDQYQQRKQIIDQCIKQVKKQIYYRNLSIQETAKIHFNETSKISFHKFTKTDKKQLIFKILSNPDILEDFYDFLFAKKTTNAEKSQKTQRPQRLTKLMDSKFNTRTLMNIKSQFNKKIYEIKANI